MGVDRPDRTYVVAIQDFAKAWKLPSVMAIVNLPTPLTYTPPPRTKDLIKGLLTVGFP